MKLVNNDIYTPESLAKLLGFSPDTIRNWCRSGVIPSSCYGRKYIIRGSDVKDFLNHNRGEAL